MDGWISASFFTPNRKDINVLPVRWKRDKRYGCVNQVSYITYNIVEYMNRSLGTHLSR